MQRPTRSAFPLEGNTERPVAVAVAVVAAATEGVALLLAAAGLLIVQLAADGIRSVAPFARALHLSPDEPLIGPALLDGSGGIVLLLGAAAVAGAARGARILVIGGLVVVFAGYLVWLSRPPHDTGLNGLVFLILPVVAGVAVALPGTTRWLRTARDRTEPRQFR